MVWTAYGYVLNSLTLLDVADTIRVLSEGGSSWRDPGQQIPGRDGFRLDPDAAFSEMYLTLWTVLRYTDNAGAVTHADGAAGHVYENLSKIKRELAGPGLATLKRTAPDYGAVQVLCRLFGDPLAQGDEDHIIHWPLVVPSGSWQDQAESDSGAASTTPPVTTSGNRRIHDPTIIFNAAGTLSHTEDGGDIATVQVVTGPTFPVTVYMAGTTGSGYLYAEDNVGADVTGDVILSKAYGLRFAPNSVLTLSSTSAVIVKWRNRWA